MSRTPNSTRRSGRSMHAARITSYVPCRRIVPAASSVANGSVARVEPGPGHDQQERQVGVGVLGPHQAQHLERRTARGIKDGRRSSRELRAVGESGATGPVGSGHLLLPERLDLTQPYRHGRSADEHLGLADREGAGGRSGPLAMGVTGPIFTRSSSNVVQAPGAGVQARIRRSVATAVSVHSTRASSTVIFGAKLTPSAGCPDIQRAVGDAVQGRDQSPAPPSASRSSRSPAVSVGRTASVISRTSAQRRAPSRSGTSSRR